MRDVPLERAVILWGSKEAPWFEVVALEDYEWRQGHYHDVGAAFTAWSRLKTKERLLNLFGEVMTAMARDGIPFAVVHPELLKIPEYRKSVISNDTPGAEGEERGGLLFAGV